MIVKFINIADIHIGKRDDIKDYYDKELSWFIKEVKRLKPHMVGVLGDLFDRKVSLSSEFAVYANKFVDELKNLKDTFVFLVQGTLSHDNEQLNTYSHLIDKNFHIYKTVTEENLFGMKCLIIPEEYEDNKEEYYGTYFKHLSDIDCVFGHGLFDFAGSWANSHSIRKNKILFSENDFKGIRGTVDFGHVHLHMRKGIVEYVSSFSRDVFGEEGEKGFLYREYDTDKRKLVNAKFIENPYAPKYTTINAKKLPEDETVRDIIFNELKKCYALRIVIDSDITEEKYNNLKAMTFNNDHLVIDKKIKGFNKKEEEEENKNVEKRRTDREALLDKYKGMTIHDITKTIATEKFNMVLLNEDITQTMGGTF